MKRLILLTVLCSSKILLTFESNYSACALAQSKKQQSEAASAQQLPIITDLSQPSGDDAIVSFATVQVLLDQNDNDHEVQNRRRKIPEHTNLSSFVMRATTSYGSSNGSDDIYSEGDSNNCDFTEEKEKEEEEEEAFREITFLQKETAVARRNQHAEGSRAALTNEEEAFRKSTFRQEAATARLNQQAEKLPAIPTSSARYALVALLEQDIVELEEQKKQELTANDGWPTQKLDDIRTQIMYNKQISDELQQLLQENDSLTDTQILEKLTRAYQCYDKALTIINALQRRINAPAQQQSAVISSTSARSLTTTPSDSQQTYSGLPAKRTIAIMTIITATSAAYYAHTRGYLDHIYARIDHPITQKISSWFRSLNPWSSKPA